MVCKTCGSPVDNAGDGMYYCPTCMRMISAAEVGDAPSGGKPAAVPFDPMDPQAKARSETILLVGMIVMILLAVLSPCGNFFFAIPAAGVGTYLLTLAKKSNTPFAKKVKVVTIVCMVFSVIVMLVPILLCTLFPFL